MGEMVRSPRRDYLPPLFPHGIGGIVNRTLGSSFNILSNCLCKLALHFSPDRSPVALDRFVPVKLGTNQIRRDQSPLLTLCNQLPCQR